LVAAATPGDAAVVDVESLVAAEPLSSELEPQPLTATAAVTSASSTELPSFRFDMFSPPRR
jgi:tetrahydromethanopterin S-methyltransferase subunit A